MPASHCRATPQVTAVDELFGTHTLRRMLCNVGNVGAELLGQVNDHPKITERLSSVAWCRFGVGSYEANARRLRGGFGAALQQLVSAE